MKAGKAIEVLHDAFRTRQTQHEVLKAHGIYCHHYYRRFPAYFNNLPSYLVL